jgi:hypothetical protein
VICIPPPPPAWNIQISPAAMLRVETKPFFARIQAPSGLQYGLWTRFVFSSLTAFASEPSAFMTQRFSAPPRSVMKAMRLPSGL